MKLIAIIPARITSKRLPNKNFKEFFGRPIIDWVLDEVRKSELFDSIVVSTDNENIVDWNKEYAEQQEFEVYPRKNLTYEQTVDDVCLEVLQEYPDYDYLCCIYPTSYAVTWQDLCLSFKEMMLTNKEYCYSIGMINSKLESDNGGFYWAKMDKFMERKKIVEINDFADKNTLQIDVRMVDINTLQDFAEAKLHAITLPCGRYK